MSVSLCDLCGVARLLLHTKAQRRPRKFNIQMYFKGKPAPLNLRSHPMARMFRTRIREQLQEEGINFAGHYTIAAMGCGTGCSTTAIVDARNGRAYFPQVLDGWSVGPGAWPDEGEDVRTFRTNSRLLKVIGSPRLGAYEEWGPPGVYYYEWKNNRLRQVHFVPTPSPGSSRLNK